MQTMIAQVRRLLAGEDGPTAVEYAVLVGLLVVALISVISGMGGSMSSTYSTVSSALAGSS
jgi:pilus assembly protein Flp/PilA